MIILGTVHNHGPVCEINFYDDDHIILRITIVQLTQHNLKTDKRALRKKVPP